jgi:hypothetical protein
MRSFFTGVIVMLMMVAGAQASHLSEKSVVAMEKKCQQQRQEKLTPERIVVVERCMTEEGLSQSACEKKHANYGEIVHRGVRTLGKYYDLPVCQEAYKARKHYKTNPGG